MTVSRLAVAVALILLAGCPEERRTDPPAPDAGPGTDGGIPGIAAPALPSLAPCPDGWREVAIEGTALSACEPWPEGGPADCGDGEAHLPGAAGCAPVGPPCPSGEFAEDLPTDRDVIYVAGTPGAGGDGSRTSPFHDLGAAFSAASGGEVFALGKGTHRIDGVFPEDVTFWGACAAETLVVPGFSDDYTGTLTAVEAARLEVRNVHVRGPTPGFLAIEGSRIEADGVIVTGTGTTAVWAEGSSAFVGRNVLVRDTRGNAMGFARAFVAMTGGRVEIHGGAVERAGEIAAFAIDEGSALVLTDVAIRDTRPMEDDGGWGRAVELAEGATGELSRVVLEGNREYGVFVGGAGTSVTIEDSVVRGTRSRMNDGQAGRGLSAQEGAQLTATRVLVDDNRELGIYGSGDGGAVTLRDVIVRRTAPREADDLGGRGIQVQWGAALDAERIYVDDNVGFGIFLYDVGTTARIVDATVAGTTPNPVDRRGRGIEALHGVQLELERVRIARNTDIGLFVQDEGTVATLRDVAIVDTQPEPDTLFYGRGASFQSRASVSGERVRILDNTELGVLVAESTLTLADVRIERTAEQACAETTCVGHSSGVGLASIDSATVQLTDFGITDNALAGIFLGNAGSVSLEEGEVARHPIGIHVGDEELDFERSLRDVAFVDNDRNVDATVLPLPDPSLPGNPDL